MRGARRLIPVFILTGVLLLVSLFAPAAASAAGSLDVLLSGLSSPKGLGLTPTGDLVFGQGAFGDPGPVTVYVLNGAAKGTTVELTDPENVVDVAFGPDGSGWAIGGDRNLYRQAPGPDGEVTLVLNIPEYQAGDPDPYDNDDDAGESNPYGLLVLPSGDALVADAQNNDLLRVTPEGEATTVARFDVETVSTDHVGDPELPPTIDAEAVPTSITLGPGGSVFVGELKGFPFRPGTSRVWKLDPDLEDALCSVNTPDPDCTTAWSGLTSIQDIYYSAQTGTLYVYELAKDGTLAYEEGFETGAFPPAVLLEVKANKQTELAAGQLSQPGGIVATNRGHVYVTDGMFSDGRLLEVTR
jgi:hypothetical protein